MSRFYASPDRSPTPPLARRARRLSLHRLVGGGGRHGCGRLSRYFAEEEGTRAVGLFLETVRRPLAFVAALVRCAEAGKPVVCLKVGRSKAAARVALSHTGALVGSGSAFSAVLRRYGAIEVEDFHELVETLEILGRRRWPSGTRPGAISESGGERALLADQADAAGIPFAPLPNGLGSKLQDEFPNYLAPDNPLDAWAVADEEIGGPAHNTRVGGVMLVVASPEAAVEAARRFGRPVLVARQAEKGPEALCGMTRDRDFGPVLAVGRGGAAVEELDRVVLSVALLDVDDAGELVAEAGLDDHEDVVARTLVALGRLALAHPEIEAVDVNPLILGAGGAVAVDALIVVGGAVRN